MTRSELVLLVLAASLAPAGAWLVLGSERELVPAPPPPVARAADPRPTERGDRERAPEAIPARGRRALEPDELESDLAPSAPPPSAPERVTVQGRVTRAGRPVAGYDVAFQPLQRPGADEEDWDFTDAGGCFDVLLPAGAWALLDGDGAWITSIVVQPGAERVRLDIELP